MQMGTKSLQFRLFDILVAVAILSAGMALSESWRFYRSNQMMSKAEAGHMAIRIHGHDIDATRTVYWPADCGLITRAILALGFAILIAPIILNVVYGYGTQAIDWLGWTMPFYCFMSNLWINPREPSGLGVVICLIGLPVSILFCIQRRFKNKQTKSAITGYAKLWICLVGWGVLFAIAFLASIWFVETV